MSGVVIPDIKSTNVNWYLKENLYVHFDYFLKEIDNVRDIYTLHEKFANRQKQKLQSVHQ